MQIAGLVQEIWRRCKDVEVGESNTLTTEPAIQGADQRTFRSMLEMLFTDKVIDVDFKGTKVTVKIVSPKPQQDYKLLE